MKNILTLIIITLVISLGVQSYRLHKEQSAHYETLLAFHEYKLKHNQSALDALQEEINHWQQKAVQREKENEALKESTNALTNALNRSERLRQQDRATIHNLTQAANQGSCEDTRQALRMCANLHAASSGRGGAMEQLAGIYATYADKLEIELKLCR